MVRIINKVGILGFVLFCFLLSSLERMGEIAIGKGVLCGSYVVPLWKLWPCVAGTSWALRLLRQKKAKSSYPETRNTI